MSSFAKPSDHAGGTYFKPADHMHDVALLIEPKRIDRDVPNNYNGQSRVRDEVTATISVFGTSEALEQRTPTAVMTDVRVVHGMLTSTLERILGEAMVAIVRKIPTKSGAGYVFRDVEPAVEAQVGAYFDQRPATPATSRTPTSAPAPAPAAAAAVAAAMPSFD
ncbi:hypothetical protein GCM10010124_02380 [Pilimelia terevasa]|uniref:Uncharacterized protein n=1 Tax=Pilimelia terevasa TaxID=53372 RepID=A0A8J3FDL6_9ACTN|nr:hypothetical protein [Pilimelia terevasa]GGK13335.1 hypothetical protein GCM10010124_02380 [Pilimelia terevasa]